MIYTLTLSLWLFAHLPDIAAKFVGWLFTPLHDAGKHRKGFGEPSSFDRGGWDIRTQGKAVEDYLIERTVESLTAPKGSPTAAIEDVSGRPVASTEVAPAGSNGGEVTRITGSDLAPIPELDPLRPRRYVLDPDWRERSGEIPVARMGELVEVAT